MKRKVHMTEISVNLYKQTNPITGTVIENKRITAESRGPKSDVRHIIIRYKEKYPYIPGQSAGIIPPGIDERTGKPHHLRLYSVASDRHGDLNDNQTISLCVVRHFFDDPKTGEKGKPGLCSNYLCDLKVGDTVQMTGPAGKHFVLPDDFLKRDIVFMATGTGIAPYRGMLKEMFDAGFGGRVWLYFGAAYENVLIYNNEFQALAGKHKNFFYVTAVSREGEKNPVPDIVPTREDKMYVQVRLYQDREVMKEIFSKKDTLLYLCGLKGMEAGIFPVLEKLGQEMGLPDSLVAALKKEHRLLVEVY
ncbi:MAG: ferredoxin--NADP(+) reductase [Candidatus Omnitrophica bacterium CG11_big_fil_rev_8_21_14_0_20_45_26]|uniref:Ferredoxin--NADP(+) reductase n=1 Tax=Candidatus Abzuiibacterium crystallinum TaxID=1974748 RepID=A0A2H0LL21_9BACT|nr:MAG: ferredoxin--NADP(+) reductase [Candidatus Omnitrophica bacterium CG11_big_fil_rev_8_21_14_0_20_45_26]PIW63824.1 MAG: ferredoxin--NADP(+) reductase [Candidatus Omnitrophica bacterium CG12_big_fil_rev_8_21_14_0_65_45_16]